MTEQLDGGRVQKGRDPKATGSSTRREFLGEAARVGVALAMSHFALLSGRGASAADECPTYTDDTDECTGLLLEPDRCAPDYITGDRCGSMQEVDECDPNNYATGDVCNDPYTWAFDDECADDGISGDVCGEPPTAGNGDECPSDAAGEMGGDACGQPPTDLNGDQCNLGAAHSGDECAPDYSTGDECVEDGSTDDECAPNGGTGDVCPDDNSPGDECDPANYNQYDRCDPNHWSSAATDECVEETGDGDECADSWPFAPYDYCPGGSSEMDACNLSLMDPGDVCAWNGVDGDVCGPAPDYKDDVCLSGIPGSDLGP